MTSKYKAVTINHSKLPYPSLFSKRKTRCGNFSSLGAFTKNGKWKKLQDRIWPATFDDGEVLDITEFKSRYYGVLRAAGFPSRYATRMVTDGSIEIGVEWPGAITLK